MMTIPQYRRFSVSAITMLICGMLLSSADASDKKTGTGAQIYQKLCIECHAKNGQGVTEKANPFQGQKSLAELTMLIEETMPEEDPELCEGEDAKQVAQYVFDRFFSPDEQDQSQASRIQLSHMTVRQYFYTTADLMSHFLGNARVTNKENGLRAEYFSTRNFKGDKRVEKRIDPVVSFQFGDKAPTRKSRTPKSSP
ncbi:c-type cytochrome [Gimesia benthica]|nr:cytochrome c [Gimesia benthica]